MNNPSSAQASNILLVEDDHALASVYSSRLEAEGFTVKHVDNGEDALSEAHSEKYDLVILDIMMPKIGGLDVLDLLRNNDSTRNLKVLMLTALSQDKDRDRAKELRADDYMIKSRVMLDEVVERVKSLISG